jgi:hypothetical protein
MKNNPLMIKRNEVFNFYGEIVVLNDDVYKSFEDRASGYRAFMHILFFYRRCRYNTLNKIFTKLFEDESAERRDKCIKFMSVNMNVHPDDVLTHKETYIFVCYYLYAFLYNTIENDTDSILNGFKAIWNYIPEDIEFISFIDGIERIETIPYIETIETGSLGTLETDGTLGTMEGKLGDIYNKDSDNANDSDKRDKAEGGTKRKRTKKNTAVDL